MPDQLLDQKPVVEQYLSQSSNPLSAVSFANIFAWQDFFQFDFKIIHDCLCVLARNEIGTFLYLPPLGKNISSAVIEKCFKMMEEINHGSGVTRIENVGFEQLSLFPTEKFTHYKKGYEYCYYRKDMVSLRGNTYKSKRSSYNQFVENYRYSFMLFTESMVDECINLYDLWANERKAHHADDIYQSMIDENRKVHRTVLEHDRQLGLIGRVVMIDGAIKAYSFGFELNKDIFCILFEISDLDIDGLAVYIFREFCRDEAISRYKFINVMDDFGMENIKKTKMSFKPCALLPAYVVTKR